MTSHVPHTCSWCYGRKRYYVTGDGKQGRGLGPCYINCPHCTQSWTQQTKTIDSEYRVAIKWFLNSAPPDNGFRLSKFKEVKDPKKFWLDLKEDLAMDNIYTLERRRDDVISLYAIFGGEEFC